MRTGPIRAAALVLVTAFATACGGPEWAPPQSDQEAEALVDRVALQADDWQGDFAPSEQLAETDIAPWGRFDEDCSWVDQQDEAPGQRGIQRHAIITTPGEDGEEVEISAYSQVIVHDAQGTAEEWIGRGAADAERCTTQDFGSVRLEDVRTHTIRLGGVDEATAESGMFVVKPGITGDELPSVPHRYAHIQARKGPVVLAVQVDGAPDRYSEDDLANLARDGMERMIDRLAKSE
ncbi:hypothetical protein [Streptomyces chumphonensis]|uniref:hypothetical protein n=1 Tax=Streptomyces chumphonensis TaxID=1214925 RepID=UPI003D71EC3B